MARQFRELAEHHINFISEQKLFFVATATAESRINLSPKGLDTLRILSTRRVLWLNLTGSGNESAAHVQHDPRMTLMFCALAGEPLILRLYGTARAMHHRDPDWEELLALFGPLPGARQIFDLSIELVQSSCGYGVPLYSYQGERDSLTQWATRKGDEGIRRYWEEKNRLSIDGLPSHIVEKNG